MMPPPTALGLFVCDRVTRDPQTGKFSLHGILARFAVPHFPGYSGAFAFFATLKGAQGVGTVAIEISALGNDTAVHRQQINVTFPDRLREVHFLLRVLDCRFPGPGMYDIALWVDQDIVAQKVVEVYQKGGTS
jgi:Family of unknown function (DUF6941)